jgi:hypothetical protein
MSETTAEVLQRMLDLTAPSHQATVDALAEVKQGLIARNEAIRSGGEIELAALGRLEQGLAEARAIIDRERQRIADGGTDYRDPYAAAFGYLEAVVIRYLPVRHHGRSPSPPSPGEVR